MRRIEHASCGYSEYAPGCDDAACLLHRVEVATARGWDATLLQSRLDVVIDVAASYLLGIDLEPGRRIGWDVRAKRP